ncbi:MAG: hypothetical protein RL173_3790 [Fibrobacterota bacterium]|jgi:putative transposase
MVSPGLRREAAQVMRSTGLSRSKSCRLAELPRSSFYRAPILRSDENCRQEVRALAHTHQKLGYRMLHGLHRNAGGRMNHKKFYRLYREENLRLRRRRRKKVVRQRLALELPSKAGIRWSMDFVFDRTEDHRPLKILTLVDDFSKESIWLEVARGIGGHDLVRILETVILIHGKPESVRTDNGSEFTSRALSLWMMKVGIQHEFIQPGKPTQNAYIESFNGRFREECLNAHFFLDLEDAREKIEQWRGFYNELRPHSALGMIPPRKFLANLANQDSHS